MKFLLTVGVLGLLGTLSFDKGQDGSSLTSKTVFASDTTIGSKIITDEIAGSAYRKRAKGYFVIIDKDTSDFTCIVTESNEEKIVIDIRYEKRSMTYKQRMSEFTLILPEAAKDFNFDSLSSLYLGRLVLNGDLAIDVTKQYRQRFGRSNTIKNYKEAAQFLTTSKLGTDLNEIFRPYSVLVDNVFPEKLFFATKEELCRANKIETDTSAVPNRILDCITWVRLKKIKMN